MRYQNLNEAQLRAHIDSGADLLRVDLKGRTVAGYVAHANYAALIPALLAQQQPGTWGAIGHRSGEEVAVDTPVTLAATAGHLSFLEAMATHGLDLSTPTPQKSALAIFIDAGSFADACRLLSLRRPTSAEEATHALQVMTNVDSWLPGISSGRHTVGYIFAALVDAGADIEAVSSDGLTPLLTAVMECNDLLVHELLANGANVNARTPSGTTVLDAMNDSQREIFADMIHAKRAQGILKAKAFTSHPAPL